MRSICNSLNIRQYFLLLYTAIECKVHTDSHVRYQLRFIQAVELIDFEIILRDGVSECFMIMNSGTLLKAHYLNFSEAAGATLHDHFFWSRFTFK